MSTGHWQQQLCVPKELTFHTKHICPEQNTELETQGMERPSPGTASPFRATHLYVQSHAGGLQWGCGRNNAERHLFSDAVPDDVTVFSVAQVMCHMTGEEEHD